VHNSYPYTPSSSANNGYERGRGSSLGVFRLKLGGILKSEVLIRSLQRFKRQISCAFVSNSEKVFSNRQVIQVILIAEAE